MQKSEILGHGNCGEGMQLHCNKIINQHINN